jgi:mannonate dehydratase
MRIVVGQFHVVNEETLLFAKQLGVESVQLNTPFLPGEAKWEYEDLLQLRNQCKAYELRLEAIENLPIKFYEKIMLGLPGRDEQIENYQSTIRNIGRVGIPILGYHFMPNFVWRTSFTTPGRGGAQVTSFDMELVEKNKQALTYEADQELGAFKPVAISVEDTTQHVSESDMWDNYAYFIKAVIPTAEEAGVKLALHPDDPPVASLGGIARLFYNVESFKKAMTIADSQAWGLELCLGCCSEMAGGAKNVMEMIEYFGPRQKIFYVHFRDVQGTVPKFQECFLGEGNFDPAVAMLALKRAGFSGFILDDHVPRVVNDSPYGHRGRAHAIGYLQGLLKMAETMSSTSQESGRV